MKSTIESLQKRGFVNEEKIERTEYINNDLLRTQLNSTKPTERTKAAILIQNNSLVELIPELIIALRSESKLYCKIAISNALVDFKEKTVKKIIPYLGVIGTNQHKTLPAKPFNKDSYPLPRDIAARILVNIKDSVIPEIITTANTFSRTQMLEAIDVLGHISFYTNDIEALPFLVKCHNTNYSDQVMQWKILRSFSAFNDANIKSLLTSVIKESTIQPLIWEAERSLRIIEVRARKDA